VFEVLTHKHKHKQPLPPPPTRTHTGLGTDTHTHTHTGFGGAQSSCDGRHRRRPLQRYGWSDLCLSLFADFCLSLHLCRYGWSYLWLSRLQSLSKRVVTLLRSLLYLCPADLPCVGEGAVCHRTTYTHALMSPLVRRPPMSMMCMCVCVLVGGWVGVDVVYLCGHRTVTTCNNHNYGDDNHR
jgi:hypothetical protein